MGKLRFDCYKDFAKRIEFPVVIFEADSGKVLIMNYEAKLILGQKTDALTIKIEPASEDSQFWTQLHDRRAMAVHYMILSGGGKEIPAAGLMNEFEVEEQRMYFLLFDQQNGFDVNSRLVERMIENSHTIVAHMCFEGQEEIRLDYISRNIKRYGYTCEEFYTGKKQFRDLIHPDDLDGVLAGFAQRSRDSQDDDCMEYRIVTEGRKVCYVRCSVHFVRNAMGGIEAMEAVMTDVTEEKLEKDENQYLRAAIEQSRSVVLVKRFLNKKGTVKYVSANALGLGMDVEDLRKGRKTFTDYILPEDRQMMTEILTNAQDIPVNNYINKCRIQGEDGVVRWIKFCVSVKTIDSYMYDVELLMNDATEESNYERNLLQNQRALEEKLDYVMNSQIQEPEQVFGEFLTVEDMQEFLEAFTANNQLYAVVVSREGELLTTPSGPMIRLGEFYDMLERPKYRGKVTEAIRQAEERQRFCILELEQDYFEKQVGAVPLLLNDKMAAVCLICAFDEEGVSRLHNSIESLQKMIGIMIKAGVDNRCLELDSRKSRLAERAMSEELEGQLILARAFAHMRSDARATMQEIIEKACELLHLTSIAAYCGDSGQEAYTCIAQYAVPEAIYQEYPEQSWRMAELCRQDETISGGGHLVYNREDVSSSAEYIMTQIHAKAMMVFALMLNGEIYGCMIFACQDKRMFLKREISYCQDVADIIQGILIRKQNAHSASALNQDLLDAYNFVSECIFIKEVQTGKVLFANEAMENLFGMDVTGMDSRAFLSEPTPIYTREGVRPVGDIKWQSYIQRVNKIMNIQELTIRWKNGEDARIVIMRENR